jgi:hypothetical protein
VDPRRIAVFALALLVVLVALGLTQEAAGAYYTWSRGGK